MRRIEHKQLAAKRSVLPALQPEAPGNWPRELALPALSRPREQGPGDTHQVGVQRVQRVHALAQPHKVGVSGECLRGNRRAGQAGGWLCQQGGRAAAASCRQWLVACSADSVERGARSMQEHGGRCRVRAAGEAGCGKAGYSRGAWGICWRGGLQSNWAQRRAEQAGQGRAGLPRPCSRCGPRPSACRPTRPAPAPWLSPPHLSTRGTQGRGCANGDHAWGPGEWCGTAGNRQGIGMESSSATRAWLLARPKSAGHWQV